MQTKLDFVSFDGRKNLQRRQNSLANVPFPYKTGTPNDNFRKNICSEDDLRSRIFGTFVVKFLACLPLLGFSNILKMV